MSPTVKKVKRTSDFTKNIVFFLMVGNLHCWARDMMTEERGRAISTNFCFHLSSVIIYVSEDFGLVLSRANQQCQISWSNLTFEITAPSELRAMLGCSLHSVISCFTHSQKDFCLHSFSFSAIYCASADVFLELSVATNERPTELDISSMFGIWLLLLFNVQ